VAVVATTAVAVVATTAVAVVATTAVAVVSGALVRVAGKIAATEVEPLQLVAAVPSMRAVPVAAVVEPTTTVAMAVPKADLTFGSD
jgi:hypothetical protein